MSFQQLLLTMGASYPSDPVAGYTAWYRGDSYNATATGQWDDKSGNGFHLNAAANKPTLNAADANFANKPTVEFNGTNQFTGFSTPTLDNWISNTAFTIFVVFRAESFGVSDGSASAQRGLFSDNGGFCGLGLGSSKFEVWSYDGAADYTGPTISLNTVYGADLRHDSGTLYNLVSGKAETSVASGNTTTLTGVVSVGRNFDGSDLWDGQIAEIIVYDTVLSTTNRQLVRDYLTGRYGISW